jgi:cyclophilin family peptidyl-prolyl cis-trans isomerase
MNKILNRWVTLLIVILITSCNVPGANEETYVLIQTSAGDIKIKLYNETPLHRDNFIKLVDSRFYEGVSFHRVIKDFMIQAGDPLTKAGSENLPDSLQHYTIAAEFNPLYFHKKGALAAARQGNDINPYMRSSGTQFYIVQGTVFTDDELNNAEQRINSQVKQGKFIQLIRETADSLSSAGITATEAEIQELASVEMFQYLSTTPDFRLSPEQRLAYTTIGGTPRLDGTYTVFGEVTEGLEIVDMIASVKTDVTDKPLDNIIILKTKIVRN